MMTLPYRLGAAPEPLPLAYHRTFAASTLCASVSMLGAASLPSETDLSELVAVCLDQRQTESCTANATSQAYHMRQMDELGLTFASPANESELPVGDPSTADYPCRLALYSWARATSGSPSEDKGSWLSSNANAIQKLGVPPESAMPFDAARINENTNTLALFHAAADQRMAGEMLRLSDDPADRKTQIIQALFARHPIVFGTSVDAAIMGTPGEVCWERTGPAIGGHALVIVGHRADGVKAFSSWGKDYNGGRGYLWITWEQLLRPESFDFWVYTLAAEFLGASK